MESYSNTSVNTKCRVLLIVLSRIIAMFFKRNYRNNPVCACIVSMCMFLCVCVWGEGGVIYRY